MRNVGKIFLEGINDFEGNSPYHIELTMEMNLILTGIEVRRK